MSTAAVGLAEAPSLYTGVTDAMVEELGGERAAEVLSRAATACADMPPTRHPVHLKLWECLWHEFAAAAGEPAFGPRLATLGTGPETAGVALAFAWAEQNQPETLRRYRPHPHTRLALELNLTLLSEETRWGVPYTLTVDEQAPSEDHAAPGRCQYLVPDFDVECEFFVVKSGSGVLSTYLGALKAGGLSMCCTPGLRETVLLDETTMQLFRKRGGGAAVADFLTHETIHSAIGRASGAGAQAWEVPLVGVVDECATQLLELLSVFLVGLTSWEVIESELLLGAWTLVELMPELFSGGHGPGVEDLAALAVRNVAGADADETAAMLNAFVEPGCELPAAGWLQLLAGPHPHALQPI